MISSTLQKLENRIIVLSSELDQVRREIKVIKRREGLNLPEYNKNWGIIEKLLYALEALGGEGTMQEVANKIHEIDDKYTKERILKFSSVKLSWLAKNNRLNTKRDEIDGRKCIYS